MDIIEKIRKDSDELYGIIQPHITIVFPFIDEISDDDLIKNVRNYFVNKTKFYVKFSGVSISDDNYIFLNCVAGEKDIIKFKVRVSKGTYIRSLISSICEKLDTLGTMNDLIRSKQGKYSIEESFTIDDINGHSITYCL